MNTNFTGTPEEHFFSAGQIVPKSMREQELEKIDSLKENLCNKEESCDE